MASNSEREPSNEVMQMISCLINAFVLPVMPLPGFTEADRSRAAGVSRLNTIKKRAMPPVIEPSHPYTSKTSRESHATGEREYPPVERIENKETGMTGTSGIIFLICEVSF